jgi:monoamine oxidase
MFILQVKSIDVKRRKALKNIGAGISAGITLPVWLSACNDQGIRPEVQYDGTVAVIGAGAAGLYVADSLRTKGVKVRLFEASGRVGGRIRSVTLADNALIETDFPIELGAERIIGSDAIWARFVNELGIPVTPSGTTDGYIVDGVFKNAQDVAADADFMAAKTFYDSLSTRAGSPNPVQQDIEAAGLSSRMFPILNSWIGNKFGSSNERLGMDGVAAPIALRTRNASELLLKSNPMHNVLISRFNAIIPQVELNSAVKSIDYSSGKIILTGEKKATEGNIENFSIEVDKVVVTVPLSIIKNGDLTFSPALPEEKLTALSKIGMDASMRVVLDFKQNFWGSDVGFIYGGETAPEYLSTGNNRSEFNKTLSITINGTKAEELSVKGDAMISDILHELDEAFDGEGSQNIRRDDADNPIFMIKDWSQEPYIKGGVSYLKPGGSLSDREQLGAPVQSIIFFAGEATHTTDAGTVNGALLSAERAVVEVVKSIVGA